MILTKHDPQSTRRLAPKHKPWTPHRYQQRGIEFLKQTWDGAALFWDPGLGKTSVVLEAFRQLREEGAVDRMLVIAPLRVCQLVWPAETRKWTQFRDLTVSFIHGRHKEARLQEEADIHLINPEGIPWLWQQMGAGTRRTRLPWDVVTVDELTRFKNHRAQRSKRLRQMLEKGGVRRRWGLTGSPVPNGYMDLFGQVLLLDDGAAFGRGITYFRDQYFKQAWNGFDWELREGSARRIEEKIAPLALRASAKDYLELPPLQDNIIDVELPPAAKKAYDEMKKETILALPEGIVTAENAGGVYSKLKQLTNGAVYLPETQLGEKRRWAEVHSAKLDALKELIEELSGTPLLVAYEFQSDLARLRAALGEDTPALAGLSGAAVQEVETAWNRGELPVLLVHPASAGHGLNLQQAAGSGTAHICWFSLPWDLELYDQTIRRLYRQGTEASRVVNHILRVDGGMDQVVLDALQGKDTTQQRLLDALNTTVLRDEPAPVAAGSAAHEGENAMVKKLGFRGDENGGGEEKGFVMPKGWGAPVGVTEDDDSALPPPVEESPAPRRPKGWGPPQDELSEEEVEEQAAAIRKKIEAPAEPDEEEYEDMAAKALAMFGPEVASKISAPNAEDDDAEAGEDPAEEEEKEAPKKRTRKSAKKEAAPEPKKEKAPEPAKEPESKPAAAAKPAAQKEAAEERQSEGRATYAYATDRAESMSAPSLQQGPGAGYAAPQEGVSVSFNLTAYGVPKDALAQMLTAFAAQLRGE